LKLTTQAMCVDGSAATVCGPSRTWTVSLTVRFRESITDRSAARVGDVDGVRIGVDRRRTRRIADLDRPDDRPLLEVEHGH
jgi:hypothetical protein